MEASGDRLTSSSGLLLGSVLGPGSSASVGVKSSSKSHNTLQTNPKKVFLTMEILPSHFPKHHASSLLVPTAEGLIKVTVTSHQLPHVPSHVPSPTLLSRQQRHVHILGRMQEQGGSGL